MPPSRLSVETGDSERGSASLEFITAGLVLLVPIVYLVVALSGVQAATLAVDGAARQATRVYVQSATVAEARAAAARAIEVTLADYGLDAAAASVQITCRPRATACLTRRGFVTVTIGLTVPLPLVPPVLDTGLPAGLPVSATATEQVSRFWGVTMNRRRWSEDDGSILPLICFYGALALLVTLIVAAATSLYLERKRLFTLADGAALVGAESFDLTQVALTPDGPRPVLTPERVHSDVSAYLDGNPIGTFESLSLDEATTLDGRSAQVTVSAIWRPPVVTAFVPDGLRIDATAVSRTVFGGG